MDIDFRCYRSSHVGGQHDVTWKRSIGRFDCKYKVYAVICKSTFNQWDCSIYLVVVVGNVVFFSLWVWSVKEELHNRFNLSLEERVKKFKHNSENLMKIGWKIRKLWHFEFSQIFTKHFLTSRYEYANEWVDDVITSLLAIYFVHTILKILIFCPNLW